MFFQLLSIIKVNLVDKKIKRSTYLGIKLCQAQDVSNSRRFYPISNSW